MTAVKVFFVKEKSICGPGKGHLSHNIFKGPLISFIKEPSTLVKRQNLRLTIKRQNSPY